MEPFVRMLSQQLPGQNRIILQCFGSMYLLLKTTSDKLLSRNSYDIPKRFNDITGLSIKQFMRLGFVLYCASAGPSGALGVVSSKYLDKAVKQRITSCHQENIKRFLQDVSCDYTKFRNIANEDRYKVNDSSYILYEFNPLKKRPLIQIRTDRWVAPNPALIIDRVTTGIFYDLLDVDHKDFTDYFGIVFQEYIGDLLKSVCLSENVLQEQEYGSKRAKKKGPADWTVIDEDFALLFECKSFIPNLDFISIAGKQDINAYAERIADAIEQTKPQSALVILVNAED